ncbi:glycosyltransferase family 4 protein [Mucilaginibacter sp. RS28]|uniref:Glycosyltransferase family 4 protein n=1 Tax=Mucilaginibacter straminoryzae TaxID=2932774 RepID=A0A9X2BDD0_9SPHI|nr:glycosyltransferase family 4 protein [Mucilaginibacter straminoryzae]MCJ8210228.1 glycosyltransferase family 4 protein [Mucilaginibacter straminoryzae]
MKITIIYGAFLPVPTLLGGAVEKMWIALAKEFVANGHEVVQICRQYEGMASDEVVDGLKYHRVKGYSAPESGLLYKIFDLFYTRRAIRKVPIDTDIIVTNTFWAPLLLSASFNKRVMVDVQRMPKGQMKFYKKSRRLRANSTPVAVAIKAELSSDLHSKVITVPNPLPFKVIDQVDLVDKKKEILYVGRVHPEKGLHLLLSAFKGIDTDWVLKIVGPVDVSAGGGGEQYLNKLKAEANERVQFVGPVYDTQKLNSYYSDAAVFVYPSVAEKGETFGLAPLEAMAWGCVPVVSNLLCFKDFIEDQKNGAIFDHRQPNAVDLLKAAIEALLEDSATRKKMAEESVKVRISHSTASIASQFLNEFKLMLNETS